MDIVFVYPSGSRWHWRRVNRAFEELFYSPVFFPDVSTARADAEAQNTQPYRLSIVMGEQQ